MSSGRETIMVEILARLKASPTNWGMALKDVRRAHQTAVPRVGAPAVHLIDGTDEPRAKQAALCIERDMTFALAIFVRSDDGPNAADPYVLEAMRRISPNIAAYPAGVSIAAGRISVNPELADADSIRVDMEFAASYPATDWTLEIAS